MANGVGEAADCGADIRAGGERCVVARAHGVNANQVFKWRRALKGRTDGVLVGSTSRLPVMVSAPCDVGNASGDVEAMEQSSAGGSIHIDFPGRAMISVG
jgi:transposase-like protein